jgi:hypothetical protein
MRKEKKLKYTLVKTSVESHYKAAQSSKLTVDITSMNGTLINVQDFTKNPRGLKQKT